MKKEPLKSRKAKRPHSRQTWTFLAKEFVHATLKITNKLQLYLVADTTIGLRHLALLRCLAVVHRTNRNWTGNKSDTMFKKMEYAW